MALAVAGSKKTAHAAGTTHTASMPADVATGDFLLWFATANNAGSGVTITAPSGWSSLFNSTVGTSFQASAIFYKISDGSEGADESFSTNNSVVAASIVWRITGAHASTAPERAAAWVTGTSTAPDSPSLDPAGWDNEEALWFATTVYKDPRTWAAPTNYTENSEGEISQNSAAMGSAYRVLSASSENPGAATLSGTGDLWGAITVAVRPAAAASSILPQMMQHYY